MYLDRRVHPALAAAFAATGPFRFLLEKIKGRPDLDLQFRHDPKAPARSKATVYFGGTRVLEVVYSQRGSFRLDANAECRAAVPYSDWDRSRPADEFPPERIMIEELS